jgi:gamma-glutamylcyclotransferase (GGCT)/AIG2-like uncharacterized protein YtfP
MQPLGRGDSAIHEGGSRRPVFLYGTLLDPGVFRRQAGTLRPWRRGLPARLPAYRRVVLRGTPYPTLVRGPGEVDGLLLILPPAPMQRLTAYEGGRYRLRPVLVVTAFGRRAARAWMAPAWQADTAKNWNVLVTLRSGRAGM